MIGPLSGQLNAIKWGEFRLGDLFEIEKTLSFNKDALTQGEDYDYYKDFAKSRRFANHRICQCRKFKPTIYLEFRAFANGFFLS